MAEETEDAGRDVRLLRSITLRNILSFGPDTPTLELRNLNVLIGPNGSGKSNLLDAVELLALLPERKELGLYLSTHDFIWKGLPEAKEAQLTVEVSLDQHAGTSLRHRVSITSFHLRHLAIYEQLVTQKAGGEADEANPFYFLSDWHGASITSDGATVGLAKEEYDNSASVLNQLRDPRRYPALRYLSDRYRNIKLYREWTFGRHAALRQPRRADERNDYLAEDGSNLGLVLSKLQNNPDIKDRIINSLNELYDGIRDFSVLVEGGAAQIFLREGNISLPATRLSDGTLRYLCLLVVLLHPAPPPLICIEEPELGLHPDAVLAVGRLIKEASARTQLVITTHSDILVDVLGEQPEDIIVCEKHEGRTQLTRLHEPELRGWLERYSLSQLWTKGQLGGTRW